NNVGQNRATFYNTLKAQVYPTWVEPPLSEWKTNPTTGIFEGNVMDIDSGLPIDHANVSLEGIPGTETVTDGNGWFGILHVPPGSYTVRVERAGFRPMS